MLKGVPASLPPGALGQPDRLVHDLPQPPVGLKPENHHLTIGLAAACESRRPMGNESPQEGRSRLEPPGLGGQKERAGSTTGRAV